MSRLFFLKLTLACGLVSIGIASSSKETRVLNNLSNQKQSNRLVEKSQANLPPLAPSPSALGLEPYAGKKKKSIGVGPHSFDYLLGADDYAQSNKSVIFIDYDIKKSVVQKYLQDGKTVICYVNVGAWEKWRSDASKFPQNTLGKDYQGWPGEKWLDIRQHDVLLPLMRSRFQTALDKGCQGIDPDNMNGYSVDTGFKLTADDQIAYNVAISEEIHKLGMMAGLKNDNEQAEDLVGFCDFAVLEECAANDECSMLKTFIDMGKPVFAIEYTENYTKKKFQEKVCPLVKQTRMSFILKKMNLRGDFLVSCL